jgi:hypothetical protein
VSRSYVAALAASALLLAGCAREPDADARRVAERMLDAASRGDGAAACAALSPAARSEVEKSSGTSCARAILEEDLGGGAVRDVHVFNDAAQVELGAGTVFLSRFDDGWRVTAAGCAPVEARPYDCAIEG